MPDTAPPADGAAVTSSWLQTMVREQVIRTVTSSTRPTGVEGAVIYETDTDLFYYYTGSAWAAFGAPATAWTAVTFTNSWVDGSGIQAVQYRKVGDVVQIRGGMRNGTIGAAAFTLPTGFRPPATFDVLVLGAAAAAGFYWTITAAGVVTPYGGSNTLSELSGILSFSITA